jgi:hypothetical protein
MPISDNEIFKFEYNPERGVTLEFSKSDGVDRIRPKRILLKQDTSECYIKEVRTKGKGYL